MAKRDQDLEQLKNFANEIAWLEAKLIQQREAREDANTTKHSKRRKNRKKKSTLRNVKTSRSESEIMVKNKWNSGEEHQPETDNDGIVPEISKAAKKVRRARRKLRKIKARSQIPKWKARRAKSTVERLMEFKEKGGKPDINASLIASPIVTVVKKTATEQTMAMELLSSPAWLREEKELMMMKNKTVTNAAAMTNTVDDGICDDKISVPHTLSKKYISVKIFKYYSQVYIYLFKLMSKNI